MKFIFPALLGALFMACARPDYVHETQTTPPPSEMQKPDLSTCRLSDINATNCLTFLWLSPPTSTAFSSAELIIHAEEQLYDTVEVLLWMPSMSHGSSPITVTSQEPGQYSLTDIFFIMPGDWEVRIYLRKNGQVIFQQFFPLLIK